MSETSKKSFETIEADTRISNGGGAEGLAVQHALGTAS